jgi:hypothetical protein
MVIKHRMLRSFKRSAIALMALLVAGVLTPSPAFAAANVTVTFTAVVESVDDFGNVLGGSINPQDVITGTYTYKLSTRDGQPRTPKIGDYYHNTAPYGINVQAGGMTFKTDPANVNFLVEIVNDYNGYDNYLLRSYNNAPLSADTTVDHIAWQLDDPSQKALSSDKLPTRPPNLSDWQSLFGLTLQGTNSAGYFYFVRAHVTKVQ